MPEIELIEKFGFPAAISLIFFGLLSWILRTIIKHFIDTIKDLNFERKEANKVFVDSLESMVHGLKENSLVIERMYSSISQIACFGDKTIRLLNKN